MATEQTEKGAELELLIVQVPSFNEEQNLPVTLKEIPRQVPGVKRVEVLVVDDGSTDGTVAAARANGADHVLSLGRNRGLARAFSEGLRRAAALGADVIVNLDADNQYRAADIPKLLEPIRRGEAEMVIGDRQVHQVPFFGPIKRRLQRLGSRVVSKLAGGARVPDAASGFRAYSREAALRINIHTTFTYTQETIIQFGLARWPIASVPIGTNPPTRPSRLFGSIAGYLYRSLLGLVKLYLIYRPFRLFLCLSLPLLLAGLFLGGRFLYYYFFISGQGKVQSLTFMVVLVVAGLLLLLVGVVCQAVSSVRQIQDETVYLVRRLALELGEKDRRSGRTLP